MKVLNSKYQHLLMKLESLAWKLGYSKPIHYLFCSILKIRNPRISNRRGEISLDEMKRLHSMAMKCDNDIFYFASLIGA